MTLQLEDPTITLPAQTRTLPAPTHTLTLTTKQRKILQLADREQEVLQHMATLRGLSTQSVVFVAVDVEAQERSHELLEFGFAWVAAADVWQANPSKAIHLAVEENWSLRNGRFVPDNKEKFQFGVTERCSMQTCRSRIQSVFRELNTQHTKVILVGHSIGHDVDWLNQAGVTAAYTHTCDIAKVYQATRKEIQLTSLANMLDRFEVQHSYLHNAGNDAVYTLRACMKLMEVEEQLRMERQGWML
jgi:uncharacterized protein YfaT (DUF1175 family)